MVEADELCDRVAIINQGVVLACDKPSRLKRDLQKQVIFNMEVSPVKDPSHMSFEGLPGVSKVSHSSMDGHSKLDLILETDDALSGVVNTLTKNDIHILNLQKREPTLEDVFVDLVGKSMEEVERGETVG
jgi:ABC-2 type transport system ATP-binding protein